MRKVLTLAAVLSLFAIPAAAQQQAQEVAASKAAAVTAAAPAAEAPADAKQAPSLFVDREQIREQVRQAEEQKGEKQQVGSTNFWYLVLAIAIGVIIAAVVLD